MENIRITFEALQKCFDSLPPAVRPNPVMASFTLACGVVRAFLGADWVERHVMPEGAKGLLTMNESGQEKLDLSAVRIIDIAELL